MQAANSSSCIIAYSIFNAFLLMLRFSSCDETPEEDKKNVGSNGKRDVSSVEEISGFFDDN